MSKFFRWSESKQPLTDGQCDELLAMIKAHYSKPKFDDFIKELAYLEELCKKVRGMLPNRPEVLLGRTEFEDTQIKEFDKRIYNRY